MAKNITDSPNGVINIFIVTPTGQKIPARQHLNNLLFASALMRALVLRRDKALYERKAELAWVQHCTWRREGA